MSETIFETMRDAMVSNQLRTSGVSDPAVAEAMRTVPREAFVPSDRADLAYLDIPTPVGEGREINPPLILGRLLTALGPRKGETALVVGAATGYSAAILDKLGVKVTALEESAALAAFAKGAVPQSVSVAVGPLSAGWAADAPYDMILIDGAIEYLPETLKAQVKDGGRVAAAVAEDRLTRLCLGRKAGDALVLEDFSDAEAVMLPGFQKPSGFIF